MQILTGGRRHYFATPGDFFVFFIRVIARLFCESLACACLIRQVRFNHGTNMEFTVAITGASGSIYAQRTLMHMAASGVVERINLIMSEAAKTVARVELGS